MALHEKLTSLAKDAATKANSLAKDAASKANTAIENGKLSLKINNEEKKIDEFTLNIGELILDQLDGGETFDDEIMALYSSIQAARDVITAERRPRRRGRGRWPHRLRKLRHAPDGERQLLRQLRRKGRALCRGRGRRRRGSGRLRVCAHRGSPGRRDHSRRGCGRRRRLLRRRGP